MFQSYALFPHMSVAANVGYGLRMRRRPKAEIARRVEEALALVKLADWRIAGRASSPAASSSAWRWHARWSSGPRFCCSTSRSRRSIANLRGAMQVELKQIQQQLGVTTIFVTHDQSEALSLSDRIAVIAAGRIRQLGTPTISIAGRATASFASFVGDVNVLPARLERVDGATAVVALGAARVNVPAQPLAGVAIGAQVDLFVRPEELCVAEHGAVAVHGTVAAQIYQGATSICMSMFRRPRLGACCARERPRRDDALAHRHAGRDRSCFR